MELADILVCPRTKNRLRLDDGSAVVQVQDSDVTYPVVDGIVDFCPDAKDAISNAYDAFSSRYDGYMNSVVSAGVFGRMFDRLVWGFSGDGGLSDYLLSHLPSEFDGVLLDVPVGTGLFTYSRYARFPNATIIAIDYSMGMLQEARMRFLEHGVKNVRLFRADVANLPLRDNTVDIVLSMSGLHAFADKPQAIREFGRVVRKQGTLLACSYVTGVRRLTDWLVKRFVERRGFFSSPFLHIDDLASELEGFTIRRQGNVKSFAWFEAIQSELTEECPVQ